MSCSGYISVRGVTRRNKQSPIKVKNSKTTTAGQMTGKMSANVEANMIARIHAPVANDGLYVRGYTAVDTAY